MSIFAIIEIQLRKMNDKGLIEDFKQSEELERAPDPEKQVITNIVNKHNWSADESWHRLLASQFDHACCNTLNEDTAKPNKKVEKLAQKILKIIDDFSRRNGVHISPNPSDSRD